MKKIFLFAVAFLIAVSCCLEVWAVFYIPYKKESNENNAMDQYASQKDSLNAKGH